MKILFVDSEHDSEILLRQVLSEEKSPIRWELVRASSADQAWHILQEQADVDMLIVNLELSENSGIDLICNVSLRYPEIKIIVISEYLDIQKIRIAMQCGASDLLTKPIEGKDLKKSIEKLAGLVAEQKMSAGKLKDNDILSMYVDKDVLRFMAASEKEGSLLSSETIEASILFIDICGYTKISELYPADQVVALLNRYFDIMVAEIETNYGLVDKFIGDCVMAVFRGDKHLQRAVETAISTRMAFTMIKESAFGGFKPAITIGLNSGEVVSGNIGSESLRRFDYTVIGDVVNTAQRFQSVALAGQIVIGEEVYSQIKNTYDCEPLGLAQFKNKGRHYNIYNIATP